MCTIRSISGNSSGQQLARRASCKPFTSNMRPTMLSNFSARANDRRTQHSICQAVAEENSQATITQRLFSAALAASVLLSSGAAFAIGPVSVKLEDLQVSKTDCGGEVCCIGTACHSTGWQKHSCTVELDGGSHADVPIACESASLTSAQV
jgi:hypothetical protein